MNSKNFIENQSTFAPQDRSITYQLKPDDYVAANKLHMRKQCRKPRFIITVTCVTLIYPAVLVSGWNHSASLTKFVVLAYLIFILTLLACYFFIVPLQTRKVYREQKSLHYPVTLRWSESGIESQNQQGTATCPWNDLFRWAEDESVFLFYLSSRIFYMLPRHAISDQQLEDLRRCINIPKM